MKRTGLVWSGVGLEEKEENLGRDAHEQNASHGKSSHRRNKLLDRFCVSVYIHGSHPTNMCAECGRRRTPTGKETREVVVSPAGP